MIRLSASRKIFPVLIAMAFVLFFCVAADACPSCKNALAESDPEQGNIAAGYFYSILFMMSMPFLIISAFTGYVFLEFRRAKSNDANQQDNDEEHRRRIQLDRQPKTHGK